MSPTSSMRPRARTCTASSAMTGRWMASCSWLAARSCRAGASLRVRGRATRFADVPLASQRHPPARQRHAGRAHRGPRRSCLVARQQVQRDAGVHLLPQRSAGPFHRQWQGFSATVPSIAKKGERYDAITDPTAWVHGHSTVTSLGMSTVLTARAAWSPHWLSCRSRQERPQKGSMSPYAGTAAHPRLR